MFKFGARTALLLCITATANAAVFKGGPVNDPSTISERINGYVKSAENFAQEKIMDALGKQLSQALGMQTKDAEENAAANTVARTNEMRSINSAADATSAAMPVDTCGIALGGGFMKTLKDLREIRIAEAAASGSSRLDAALEAGPVAEEKEYNKSIEELLDREKEARPEYFSADENGNRSASSQNGGDSGATRKASMLEADRFFKSRIESEEMQAAVDMIALAAPKYSPPGDELDDLRQLDDNKLRIEATRQLLRREIPRQSLLSGLYRREVRAEDGNSEIGVLEDVNRRFYLDEDSMASRIMAARDEFRSADAVWRAGLVMKAFQLHMSMKQYEANQRQLMLWTHKLNNKVSP